MLSAGLSPFRRALLVSVNAIAPHFAFPECAGSAESLHKRVRVQAPRPPLSSVSGLRARYAAKEAD